MGTAERGPRLLGGGNSGRIEWKMRVACVALALFPQQRDRKWSGDPGRTQALLCVSLSSSHQTLHSSEMQERAQGPLLHPHFTVTSLLRWAFQVVIRGRAAQFNAEGERGTFSVDFSGDAVALKQCFSHHCATANACIVTKCKARCDNFILFHRIGLKKN